MTRSSANPSLPSSTLGYPPPVNKRKRWPSPRCVRSAPTAWPTTRCLRASWSGSSRCRAMRTARSKRISCVCAPTSCRPCVETLTMPMNPTLRQPLLVGIGAVMQREEDASLAREPLALMEAAVRQAGSDSGCAALLTQLDHIAVPKGRWQYANPAGAIGRAIGSPDAVTILATVGVLQQSFIGDSCRRIAEGGIETAVVVVGDAGYPLLPARLSGVD